MTDETREQAILICAIAASSRWDGSSYSDWLTTWAAGREVDASSDAMLAADAAWFAASRWLPRSQDAYAEAEALLQTGWEP